MNDPYHVQIAGDLNTGRVLTDHDYGRPLGTRVLGHFDPCPWHCCDGVCLPKVDDVPDEVHEPIRVSLLERALNGISIAGAIVCACAIGNLLGRGIVECIDVLKHAVWGINHL